jgi:DNA polymerase-3 subunit epsilon
MRFVAIDVESANPDMGSICQIGIAKFVDGQLVGEWSTLVDPEDYFDAVNVSIHGIEPHMVRGQPKLPAIAEKLRSHLLNTVSVCTPTLIESPLLAHSPCMNSRRSQLLGWIRPE